MKLPKTITAEKLNLLQPHLAHLRETLAETAVYDFPADIKAWMSRQKLNASQLAVLCNVTHPVIKNWTSGQARPRGKEQIKILGLALGLDMDELNLFLLRNSYPRLTSKNPLDGICIVVLKDRKGNPQNAPRYRAEVQKSLLRRHTLTQHTETVATAYLTDSLIQLDSEVELKGWLDKHTDQFTANERMMLASRNLRRFIKLHQGDAPVNAMVNEGRMPPGVPNQLFPILSANPHPFPVRGMRRKLIVFGLYNNMASPDIDKMMELAGLLPISQPATKTDWAILTAMNYGHECYPYYEFDTLFQLHCDVVDVLLRYTFSYQAPPALYKDLQEAYQKRLGIVHGCLLYYDEHRGEGEKLFETLYTDRPEDSDNCLLDYVRDVLILLTAEGTLPENEVKEWLNLIRT